MSAIQIRKAVEGDVHEILALIRELAAFEHGLNQVTVSPEELLRDGFGDNALFECLVAEREGQVLGIAVYFYNYSTWNGKCLYLEDLIISREHRFEGVGSILMEELILKAQQENVKRISWQVLDWNLDAQDFYRKFGASLDNEWLNGRLDERQIRNYKRK